MNLQEAIAEGRRRAEATERSEALALEESRKAALARVLPLASDALERAGVSVPPERWSVERWVHETSTQPILTLMLDGYLFSFSKNNHLQMVAACGRCGRSAGYSVYNLEQLAEAATWRDAFLTDHSCVYPVGCTGHLDAGAERVVHDQGHWCPVHQLAPPPAASLAEAQTEDGKLVALLADFVRRHAPGCDQ